MREDLAAFSDVLVMDTTYKVNKYLYPLVNVMCIDGEGCGRPVLHGFIRVEQSQYLLSCLQFLKSVVNINPSVFFVDKDFAEISAVRDAFPDTSVKLCAFHASNAVRKALQNRGLSSSDIGRILAYFMEQRDTVCQEKYLELQRLMQESLSRDVVAYFEDNWWNIAHMWAAHTTLDLQTFHVTTTNHVESYHAKIKQQLDSHKTFTDCLAALITYDRDLINTRNIHRHINNISHQYNTTDSCPAIQTIKEHLSNFAAKVVVRQLLLARNVSYRIESLPSGLYEVTGGVQDSPRYEASSLSCTCSFFSKFNLPCRHIFAVNIHLDVPLCDVSLLTSSRFHRRIVCPVPMLPISSDINEQVTSTSRTSTQEGWYRLVSALTSQINSLFQVMGESCFQSRLQQLQSFFDLVRADREILILDASGDQLLHTTPVPRTAPETVALSPLPQTAAVQVEEATPMPSPRPEDSAAPSDQSQVQETIAPLMLSPFTQTAALQEEPASLMQSPRLEDSAAPSDPLPGPSGTSVPSSFTSVVLPKVKPRGRPRKIQNFTSRSKKHASASRNVLVNGSICYVCGDSEVNKSLCVEGVWMEWIGCSRCVRWYHTACLPSDIVPATFLCSFCIAGDTVS